MAIMAVAIILLCGTADAQPWRSREYRVATVVSKPTVTVHVSNHFNQRERLRMAMAYLKRHDYLIVKKYAKMVELSKASVKAELDAFVADKNKPVKVVIRGKKKVYTLKGRT